MNQPTTKLTTYRFTCKTCNESWTRAFQHSTDIEHYLRLRDVCLVGCHMAEPSLQDHVTYEVI